MTKQPPGQVCSDVRILLYIITQFASYKRWLINKIHYTMSRRS